MLAKIGLGGHLGIAFALVAAIVGATICSVASLTVAEDLQHHVQQNLSHLAVDIDHSIDLAISQRLEHIRAAADSLGSSGLSLTGSDASAWTDALQSSFSDITWVSLIDPSGRVAATSGDGPEVGSLFPNAPSIEETRRLTVTSLGAGQGRYLVSRSLLDGRGKVVGQMLAEIGEGWMGKAVESVLSSHLLMEGEQVLVTDSAGRLLGFSSSRGVQPGGGQFPPGETPFEGRRDWPDGESTLTVVLSLHGNEAAQALRWQVVVREGLEQAEAPASAMRQRIYGLGVLLSLVGAALGILAAQGLARPLRRLALSARQIADGQLVGGIPRLGLFRELAQLSGALRDMVGTLRSNEARLSMLNKSLAEHVRNSEDDFKAAHSGLLANEAKLRAVIETAIDGVMIIDEQGVIETFNRSCQTIFGWSERDILGRTVMTVMPHEWQALHQQLFKDQQPVEEEKVRSHARVVRGCRKDGTQFPLEVSLTTTVVGEKPIFVAMVRDISERVVADEKLFAMATQDGLTGVRNRRYFLEGLESEVARCRRHGRPLSLLSLDADYFKAVNDTFGHEAGDRVLRRIADSCRGNLREVDLVGRMGGEEFAIAMPDTDLETARMAAERLRLMVAAERIDYDGQTLQVTMSVGISALRDHGLDFSLEHCIEDLMRRADKALYQAKKAGRNRVVVDMAVNESVSNALGG